MTTWVWSVLGIAPTDDVRAIRSAYAGELKSFDPDQDEPRYARLREARELALRLARSAAVETVDPFAEAIPADAAADAPIPPEPSTNEAPPARPGREPPRIVTHAPHDLHDPVHDTHYPALVALLSAPSNGRPPDAERAARMMAHLDAILADPRMQQLTYRSSAEERLFHLLASTTPQSDPLLPRAIDEFSWRERAGRFNQPQILESLIRYSDESKQRHNVLADVDRFRHAIGNPAHEHHLAWRDLTGTVDTRATRRTPSVQRVGTLLSTLRQYFPQLLDQVDPERVRYWENEARRQNKRKEGLIGIAVLLVFAFFIAVAMLAPPAPQKPRSTDIAGFPIGQLQSLDTDLEPALRERVPDRSASDVARTNPALYAALRERWDIAQRDGDTLGTFTRSTVTWLDSLFDANLRRAPRDDLEEYRQIEEHRLRTLSDLGDGSACGAYLDGDPTPPLDGDYRERFMTLEGRLILDMPYHAPPAEDTGHRYTVPGVVMTQIGRRTGLPRTRVSAALSGHGSSHDRCATRIALIQAALHLRSAEGTALLRDM